MSGFGGLGKWLATNMAQQRHAQGLPTPWLDRQRGVAAPGGMPDVYAQRGQEMGYMPQPPAPAFGMGKPTVGGATPPVMAPGPQPTLSSIKMGGAPAPTMAPLQRAQAAGLQGAPLPQQQQPHAQIAQALMGR